jgi:hypothetical protein
MLDQLIRLTANSVIHLVFRAMYGGAMTWRDALISKQLLWRYPELARGPDFLEFIAKQRGEQLAAQSAKIFSDYMRAQHLKEIDVKFQQVQIQSNLLDLFTDMPIGLAREKMPTSQALNITENDHRVLESIFQRTRHIAFGDWDNRLMATRWLLRVAPQKGIQRIVLEGAPGQGKSTVTQYLCQIHRSIGLRKSAEEARIPEQYRNHTLRSPMRVGLRDYALWLTGKDPTASEKNVSRPNGSDDSLESLVSYQIHRLSGGKSFNLENLSTVLKDSHCLLVLDGFDEVADTSTRSKLIEQM